MLDLLIIGAGPVGLFAAFEAGSKNIKAEVVENLSYVGGQLSTLYPEKPIYDFPGFSKIKAKDLISALYEQYSPFKEIVPIHFNCDLTNIEKKEDYYIVKTSLKTFETKTILLTTGNGGFNPRKLELDGANDVNNLSYFVENPSKYQNKNVVILGGGDSALDYGNMLKGIAKTCTIIHRRNEFRANEESIRNFATFGNILTPYNPIKLIIENNEIKELVISKNDEDKIINIPLDELVVSYGLLPAKLDYSSFGLNIDSQGILVKRTMQTNLENIYACGNCVSYEGKIKTIVSGMGEVAIAMHEIEGIIFPNKSKNVIYYKPKEK